jgi:predicted ribonuclease YlaK
MIIRTYFCEGCGTVTEQQLTSEQWDDPPPECQRCAARMQQEFRPVAIGGSVSTRARDTALEIAAQDYHVADIDHEHRREGTPKVRYKDANINPAQRSSWTAAQATLEAAIAAGRQSRIQYGSGLDVLQANLKSGAQPDLIEISKKRSARVW